MEWWALKILLCSWCLNIAFKFSVNRTWSIYNCHMEEWFLITCWRKANIFTFTFWVYVYIKKCLQVEGLTGNCWVVTNINICISKIKSLSLEKVSTCTVSPDAKCFIFENSSQNKSTKWVWELNIDSILLRFTQCKVQLPLQVEGY